ncbi:MAG: hypothetical protein EXR75_12475 [Myxococcales bacterium]|nr:hypothetical protein [Myxococcales bacterium]
MAEHGDFAGLDRLLVHALGEWRARTDELCRIRPEIAGDLRQAELDTSPLPERLVGIEAREELADAKGDMLARALVPWVDVLANEDESYRDRVALHVALAQPHDVAGRDAPVSARALRRELWMAPSAALRRSAGDDLARVCRAVADVVRPALERRVERARRLMPECRPLSVAELPWDGQDRAPAARVAEQVLHATEELAASFLPRSWHETLRLAFATDASEGWPARLSGAWLGDVFGGTGLTAGLTLRPHLPETCGALSYAAALGNLGARVLDAARPATLPFALQQHPLGVRRHHERALFAGIVAEPSFARRVLGLSRSRVADHRRHVWRAFLVALRIDAWRVVASAASQDGMAPFVERYRDVGERVLGPGLAAAMAGVLPMLRPGDGAALVGTVLAARRREELVAAYDEDWFANPRAIEELRHEATLARSFEAIAPASIEAALNTLMGIAIDAVA